MPCTCQSPTRAPCWFCSVMGLLLGTILGVCIFSIWVNWETAPPGQPVIVKIVRISTGGWTYFERTDNQARFRDNAIWGEIGDVFCWENCDAEIEGKTGGGPGTHGH